MRKTTLLLLLMMGIMAPGCGEKIAIPEPKGLFSVSAYKEAAVYDTIDDPRQIALNAGVLFLIHGTSLSKRDQYLQEFDNVEPVTGFGNPTALCILPALGAVFVYDEANTTVSWFAVNDLALLGSASVPDVLSVVSMETQANGIELVPSGLTFLYMSDPTSGVIHRYALTETAELIPFGILASGGGQSARFVHDVAGLAVDHEGKVLVCDADPERNWVIRFDSTPDTLDTTPNEDDIDPMRGLAFPFPGIENCDPQPIAAYVMGDAPECNETTWQGAPSEEPGEFHSPRGVDVDGSGRSFICDTDNSRVQIFAEGEYSFYFVVDAENDRRPVSISVMDREVSPIEIFYAAFVYVMVPDDGLIYKYISSEEFADRNPGVPFTP